MIIRPQDKAKIIQIAKQSFKTPIELLAYGSRVDGTAHDTSDLDLALRSKDSQPIDAKELAHFKNSINDSNLPILVQILDWTTLPESFRQNIIKNHIVLYQSK